MSDFTRHPGNAVPGTTVLGGVLEDRPYNVPTSVKAFPQIMFYFFELHRARQSYVVLEIEKLLRHLSLFCTFRIVTFPLNTSGSLPRKVNVMSLILELIICSLAKYGLIKNVLLFLGYSNSLLLSLQP